MAEALYLDTSAVLRAVLESGTPFALPERRLGDAEREIASLWARCNLWELTPAVCDLAAHAAPGKPLRTLDALHLATFVLARRRFAGLELLTVDARLHEAADLT